MTADPRQASLFGVRPAPLPAQRQADPLAAVNLRAPRPPVPTAEVAECAPCWKWVGGKDASWPAISPRLPAEIEGVYFEPFVGGGATFWNLMREGRLRGPVVLSDANPLLIAALRGIQAAPRAVIQLLQDYVIEYRQAAKETYLRIRGTVPEWSSWSPEAVAAGFIFLNRTGFNGLWRENKKGGNNVAWCKDPWVRIVFPERLMACSAALRGVTLLCADFGEVVQHAQAGDVVFVDPPYVPVSDTANFTAYTADGFGPAEHMRARDTVVRLARAGVRVVACNADLPVVRAWYAHSTLEIHSIQAARNVNRDAAKRGPVGEVLIVSTGGQCAELQ